MRHFQWAAWGTREKTAAGFAQLAKWRVFGAIGYAVFDPIQDRDIQDTIRRGDAMRYEDEKQKKQTQPAWDSAIVKRKTQRIRRVLSCD